VDCGMGRHGVQELAQYQALELLQTGLGRFNQPDRSSQNSWAHPVVADGKLYLRDQDVLLCYNVKAK